MRRPIRVSTTQLESFRLWREGDWMSDDELIATIRGQFVPTHPVNLGSAFGRVLETPAPFAVSGGYQITVNGETFGFGADVMAPCLALMNRRGVFEAKGTREYDGVTVVARADQIVGLQIIEHKTTLGGFDFDKYAASAQWRFMLDIFEGAMVTYHVFCLSEATNGVIALRGIESFNLFPYPALQQDCRDLLRAFTEFVDARDLRAGLELRHAEAAA